MDFTQGLQLKKLFRRNLIQLVLE
ncbi:hypothetical protein NC653_029685 [Populus alba x Populus x berolinensis]|uniref:Uncharacterized protein n=1 Tax=Populus alba x Populus x berolinensis TaxID=444605 RepID=A0AAD6M315_9ROSI|nr:hypothetical protein NC653_029685 [Populus alba x Populus x berolinensis]